MKHRRVGRTALALAIVVVGWSLMAVTIGTSAGRAEGSWAGPTFIWRSAQPDAVAQVPGQDPTPPTPTTTPSTTPTTTPTTTMPSMTSTTSIHPTPEATPAGTAIPSPALASPTPTVGPPKPTPSPRPTPSPTDRPSPGWVTVVDDTFAAGRVPSHWSLYDAPYGSGAHNCASPSHVTVSGGVLHLLLSYEAAGSGSADCGPGWYSGGMSLSGYSSVDQQVTVRFRVVRDGIAGHFIVPMRWPDDDSAWPAAGEEDYCETSDIGECSSFLHYSPDNRQIYGSYAVDMTGWHTIRTERRDHQVRLYIDDMTHPAWSYVGSSSTLPDTLKHVLLQQECESSCPNGTTGTEDIQVDRITVANPG